ncbi:MAG: hypothetical protein KAU31_17010, partial [Spirochaetaceae bacterium]|nr:hypothetical protein [Spirochaetaceae bacterium]
KTEVYCGVDHTVEQKLEWIRDKNIQLAMKLSRVKQELVQAGDNGKLTELRDNLQAAIHKMNEAACALVDRLDRNEEAEVVVRGTVYPGVYIEICHCSFIVTREVQSVRFVLDKDQGTVVTRPLSAVKVARRKQKKELEACNR